MAGGQDYSQSTSESTSLGIQNKKGDFTVGGGIRIPSWFWPVALGVVALVAVAWLFKRKS